jgi:hypothetical protein
MSRVVYGTTFSWVSETFFVEKDRKYSVDDPSVAEALRRHPWAFSSDEPPLVEQTTAAPGERRVVRRGN